MPTRHRAWMQWIWLPAMLFFALPVAWAQPGDGGPDSSPVADDAGVAEDGGATDDAEVEAALRALAAELDDKDHGEPAVAELVTLGDERVKIVLQRLMDRTLYLYEGRVYHNAELVKDATGTEVAPLRDLLSDDPATDAEGRTIVVAKADLNKLRHQGSRGARRAAKDALSVIDLLVKNPETRLAAAKRVGDTRQADALPQLLKMAEEDPHWKVRLTAAESAAIIVAEGGPGGSVGERLAAIAKLGELDSIRGRPVIERLLADPVAAGLPERELRPIAAASLRSIGRHESLTRFFNYSFQGLSAGSILVLLALGLAITFGVMGVINMAHGEMLMIGAVTTWAMHELFLGRLFIGIEKWGIGFMVPGLPAEWFNWYYVAAFPLSFLAAATVGLIVELTIVRFLYKRPLDSLLATIGVSFVLIQAVRSWRGDNLGMSAPTWFTGGVEVMQDCILPYNRLFIIALAAFCVAATAAMFRFTRLGLMIRATVQDREMAQALGVNTRLVDMLTFAYGAGLAGLAGYAIVLLSNPTPEMGQGYIVNSFLVVVVGGVGKLVGVIVSGLSLGFLTKFIEPITLMTQPIRIFDATWAQVFVLMLVVLFMQRRPAGLFPEKGRLADRADGGATPFATQRTIEWRRDGLLGAALAVLGLLIVPGMYLAGLASIETVNKIGYFVSFAIVAVGLDMLWGYMGVLSLCQFMFFALGGYCMGLYLINYGPMDGANGDIPRALFVVMSSVSGAEPPWFLSIFKSFAAAVVLGLLLPGLLALLIGLTTFRSRVKGVYFAILTQAITVAAWLVFQKNDLKLGGTNGLTNFTHILGYPIAPSADAGPLEQTRFWMYIASVVALLAVLAIAKALMHSGYGRVLIAIRDDETRLLFRGYQAWVYKTATFTIAAMFAGLGGMLYVPQKGIITPHQIAAGASILVVVWVALGGRGTLWGAAIGALLVNLLYDWLTTSAADKWPFVLGALFILVPLVLPGGVMSLPALLIRGLVRANPRKQADNVSSSVRRTTA